MIQSKSLACVTHTYFDDTVITSLNLGGISIYQAVGNMLDPYFGITTAATYFQVVPVSPGLGFYFPAPYQIDSAVLIMPYSGFTYGDSANTTLTQSYQVFEMTDTLGYYSNYFSYSTKPTGQALSNVVTVNLHNLQDSVSVLGVMQHPHMRIRLNNTFLHYIDSTADVKATDPTTFMNTFPGFCVRVADTRQTTTALPYFELDGADAYSQAGVVVYYHTAGAVVPDTLLATYPFNTGYCAHFNSIKRSYGRYPVSNLYNSHSANDSIIALQNQPGAGIDLVVQNIIDSLPKNIVINKAEVQISLLPQGHTDTVFFAPQILYPLGISSSGAYTVADRYPTTSITPLALLDGYPHNFTYNTGSTNIITYTVNIPRELQASISAGQNTLHLHLNGSQNFYAAYRMLAAGGNYSDPHYRAKLFVVYSKLSK